MHYNCSNAQESKHFMLEKDGSWTKLHCFVIFSVFLSFKGIKLDCSYSFHLKIEIKMSVEFEFLVRKLAKSV